MFEVKFYRLIELFFFNHREEKEESTFELQQYSDWPIWWHNTEFSAVPYLSQGTKVQFCNILQ